MPEKPKFHPNNSSNLRHEGRSVKARLIAAGVRLGDIAAAVGCDRSLISHYLAGRVRNPETQHDIYIAFRALGHQDISERDFWGALYTERTAAK